MHHSVITTKSLPRKNALRTHCKLQHTIIQCTTHNSISTITNTAIQTYTMGYDWSLQNYNWQILQ